MAIFYDMIKGLPKDKTNAKETKNITFTENGIETDGRLTSKNGLTVNAGGADISGDTIIRNKLTVTGGGADISGDTIIRNKLTVTGGGADISGTTTISANNTHKIEVKTNTTIITGTTTITDKLTVTGNGADITGSVSIEGDESNLTVKGFAEASYFNATSDSRAKENIKSRNVENFLVLEDLSKWGIYSFNYKNDPKKETQIGIIAQEHLASTSKLGFELVHNQEATGEKDDFMSVKESKIPYLTVQAIQALNEMRKVDEKQIMALQKENSQLKSQINDLQVQISILAETIKKRLN